MAVGPIQFSASTNPIDGLNARLRAMGRTEIIAEIRTTPRLDCGGHYNDITYIARNGERRTYGTLRGPMDGANDIVANFLTHVSAVEKDFKDRADMEYQQYLDDHKAMTLGSLFGENRFPRARERAFLDFRTQAASQTRYESFDYSDPHSGAVKKVLDAYLTHHLPDLSSIKCELFVAVEHDHAVVQMSTPMPDWRKCRTIRIPLSQDMPWYTASQQARDTLREWIASAEESVAAEQKNPSTVDYTVWIWGIEYPNARVEYRDGIERVRSVPGFTHGVYKAGAKTSGVPRTVEENGPFDIVLKHRNGDIVALHGCSWVADGEVCCTSIMKNGKSSFQPEMSVAAAQNIPAGAMVNSDGEVVGKATPARAMAYLNGEPMGVVTNIDYSGIVHLNTDAEGRVTTTVQQVADLINAEKIKIKQKVKQEAIDRGYAATMQAISVPTRDEIKRSLLERVANDGSRNASDVIVDLVAESTHETYKAIAQVAEGLRLREEARKVGFGNLSGQPLTQEALKKAFAELMKPMAQLPNPLDFAPRIGDNESMSETNAGAADNSTKLPAISIEILNKHFELSGIQAVVKSIKAHPRLHGGYDHRAYYIGRDGEEHSFDWFQGPSELPEGFGKKFIECLIARGEMVQRNSDGGASDRNIATKETTVSDTNPSFKNRATAEAIEVAYRTAAIKLPELVKRQLVKRMASKGGKRPSQARLSLAEEMLSGDEGSLIVAGILSLALSASPEFIKSKMPWLDLNRLATELRLNVETRIACAVADMLGMYLDGALEALKEAFGGSQQLLLAEGGRSDESALFNGVPKAETVRV